MNVQFQSGTNPVEIIIKIEEFGKKMWKKRISGTANPDLSG